MSNLLEQHFQNKSKQTFGLLLINLFCVGIFTVILCSPATAQTKGKKPTGSSHRSYRAAGIKAIPFSEINAHATQRIKEVVDHTSFYRRLPVQSIDADPEYFRLLVRKPELIVNIWQLMGVTQMSTERTGPYSIKTNDGAGTISDLELIYGNDKLHVFYGNGSYKGPMLKQKLTGRCVIVLQTQSKETTTGFELTNVLDIYLRVDNATASLITRTIQPLVGTTADHNFTESLKFVQRLNQSTRLNGPGVKGMGRKLKIEPQVRKDFELVVDKVYARATKKNERLYPRSAAPRVSSASQQSTRPRATQQVVSRRQADKSQSLPPKRTKLQPVVPPGLISSVASPRSKSGSRFVRANAGKNVNAVEDPPLSSSEQPKLATNSARPGVSVLVGGPRHFTVAKPPIVSVADQSKLTKPKFDPDLFPKQSTKR